MTPKRIEPPFNCTKEFAQGWNAAVLAMEKTTRGVLESILWIADNPGGKNDMNYIAQVCRSTLASERQK